MTTKYIYFFLLDVSLQYKQQQQTICSEKESYWSESSVCVVGGSSGCWSKMAAVEWWPCLSLSSSKSSRCMYHSIARSHNCLGRTHCGVRGEIERPSLLSYQDVDGCLQGNTWIALFFSTCKLHGFVCMCKERKWRMVGVIAMLLLRRIIIQIQTELKEKRDICVEFYFTGNKK